MTTVGIHEAKTHFSKLIQRALAGEEIVISKGKKPLVQLCPLANAQEKRKLGNQPDFIESISPDFDEPIEAFEEYLK